MEKCSKLFNTLVSVAILFAIVFQSVHSFEHLVKQILEKKCFHNRHFHTEITHQHKSLDQCFVCEFTFSSYVITPSENFEFEVNPHFFKDDSYFDTAFNYYFKGISYPLRGPPTV